MPGSHNQKSASAALRNAVPYLRLYQGRTFVVKAGGEAFAQNGDARALLEQIAILHRLGIRVVLVHGGGPQITSVCERLGIEPRIVAGRRVTDDATLEAVVMTLAGTVNTGIVARFRALDTRAVGLSCVDGGIVLAHRREPQETTDGTVDYGRVGDIEHVDGELIARLLDDGFLPVVSPLCADASGAILNVNADVVAARLAVALAAEKLIYMTGAPGILRDPEDPGSLVTSTDVAGLADLEESGALRGGMLPKAASIAGALRGGVRRVHVISHALEDSLLVEIFTNEGSGTLVVAKSANSPQAGVP